MTPALTAEWSDRTDLSPLDMGAVLVDGNAVNAEIRIYRNAGASAFAGTAEIRNNAVTAIGRWF